MCALLVPSNYPLLGSLKSSQVKLVLRNEVEAEVGGISVSALGVSVSVTLLNSRVDRRHVEFPVWQGS